MDQVSFCLMHIEQWYICTWKACVLVGMLLGVHTHYHAHRLVAQIVLDLTFSRKLAGKPRRLSTSSMPFELHRSAVHALFFQSKKHFRGSPFYLSLSISPCIYLSIHPSIYLSIYVSTYLSI
jgi:hypothetical protein